jgi:hypothetical protein
MTERLSKGVCVRKAVMAYLAFMRMFGVDDRASTASHESTRHVSRSLPENATFRRTGSNDGAEILS